MGHRGFSRQWADHAEQQWNQHAGRRGGGPWGGFGPGGFGRPGHPGPPPWVAGLFGLAQGERQRGPRVRRGDVRAAILDVVRTAQWSRRADQRLPGDPADRRAQQRRLAPEPRIGLPDHPAARGRGPARGRRHPGRRTLQAHRRGPGLRRRAHRRARRGLDAVRGARAPGRRRGRPQARDRTGDGSRLADRHHRQRPAAARRRRRSWPTPGAGSTASWPRATSPTTRPRRTRDRRPPADERHRPRAGGRRARRALRPGAADLRRVRRAARSGLGGAHPRRARAALPRPAGPVRTTRAVSGRRGASPDVTGRAAWHRGAAVCRLRCSSCWPSCWC